jgi:nitroreductase
MDVYEAVTSRRSVRKFLDSPVPLGTLERVLSAALRTPSGGNLQPWRVYVVTGARLEDLKTRIRERIAAGDRGDDLLVLPYPSTLPDVYAARLDDMGTRRYGAVGVDRDDHHGRARIRAGNWECYGAPVAVFCYVDARMSLPQWNGVGAFLQTVMLLLRAEGLDSCAQIAWAEYHNTVREIVGPPAGELLACGLSIGYSDPDEPAVTMPRAELHELVSFV